MYVKLKEGTGSTNISYIVCTNSHRIYHNNISMRAFFFSVFLFVSALCGSRKTARKTARCSWQVPRSTEVSAATDDLGRRGDELLL